MSTYNPTLPEKRIEILDILRGFAYLGIIFYSMLYFSGYIYMPFDVLKQSFNFQLNERVFHLINLFFSTNCYALFYIIFGIGFYIQIVKHRKDQSDYIRTYIKRIFILLAIGILHSLIWYVDFIPTIAIYALILLAFRNVKSKNILRWAIFFILLPLIIDFTLLLLVHTPESNNLVNTAHPAHVYYPDITNEELVSTFQNGSFADLLKLDIHNNIWKYSGYFPAGKVFSFLGIFLFGFYLASIGFFTKKLKLNSILVISMFIGVLTAFTASRYGGSLYKYPPSLHNILYKFLLFTGQIFLCLFYISAIMKIARLSVGKRILKYLIPLGRMTLSNYIIQTIIMIFIFYSFGLGLFGKISLVATAAISVLISLVQIVISNIWLKYYRFGPLEWIWRSLSYGTRISNRLA